MRLLLALALGLIAASGLALRPACAQEQFNGRDQASNQGDLNCPPPVINGITPKNWSCPTGTQTTVGKPNCPPPVVNGVTPKNWSCKTVQQPMVPPNLDNTMQTVVASCGVVLQQQGSLDSRPGCESDAVTKWCARQKANATCEAIVAQAGPLQGSASHSDTTTDGGTPMNPVPSPPAVPVPAGMVRVLVGNTQGYYNPNLPYYNGKLIDGNAAIPPEYTIDVTHENGQITLTRSIQSSADSTKKVTGTVTPHYDATGYLQSMTLTVNGQSFLLFPSKTRLVPLRNTGKYVPY